MTVEPLHHLIYMKTLTHNFNDIPLFLDLKIDTKWFELYSNSVEHNRLSSKMILGFSYNKNLK